MSSVALPQEASSDLREPEAFAALYREHAPRIFRFLLTTLRDRAEAEDALQDVFLKAFRFLGRDRPASPEAWLLTLARNTAIDLVRQRKPTSPRPNHEVIELADRSVGPAVSPPVVPSWITEPGLHEALDSLPARQREVIVLRYLLGCSHGQSARVLGSSEAAVRQSHHLALRALAAAASTLGLAPSVRRRDYGMRRLRLPRRRALGGFTLLRPTVRVT